MTQTIQWGTRATIHRRGGGLTLGAINTGAYAEIPDFWEDRSRMPRGTFNPSGIVSASIGGYYLRNKSDLWADNCAGAVRGGDLAPLVLGHQIPGRVPRAAGRRRACGLPGFDGAEPAGIDRESRWSRAGCSG